MKEDKNILPLTDEQIVVEKSKYTRTITTPIYEPKNKMPSISDIYDFSKRDELVDEINNNEDLKGDINSQLRNFLLSAAERHVVFDFSKIADFYSHMPVKYKQLFEKSGLVIIDFDNAIRNSFITYEKEVEKTRIEYLEENLTAEKMLETKEKERLKQCVDELDYLKSEELKNSMDEEW